MKEPKQPPREASLDTLVNYVRERVVLIFEELEAKGYHPIAFETRRSLERQSWLYGYGRTHHRGERPVTWTMSSKHLVGKAVDVVERETWWNDPEFFEALEEAATKHRMKVIATERCHIEWS